MLEQLPASVKIVEVGPRDGLQNEAQPVSTANKIRLIEAIAAAGMKHIEVTSFVSPKWIPQLADGQDVVQGLHLDSSIDTSALVPNLQGLERAKQAGLKHIALFMSASETHSKKNINKTIDEAIETLGEVAKEARRSGMRIRAYMSVVFACPYEGKVSPSQVAKVTSRLLNLGIDELSLGDTIGAATPLEVEKLVRLISKDIDLKKIALHFHDTRGTALANVLAGLDSGVTIFDSSLGGLGGCPYAPGAAGNLATEDLVYMLDGMGIKTGINLEKLVDAGLLAQELLGKKLPGRFLQASLAQRVKT
jgi:hydroxymethylglutaryl-CoA lyase